MDRSKAVLPVIVVSQFFCTSLWFAGNGVMSDLVDSLHLEESALGHLTSAIQFGFIAGTLIFAVLAIADRFSPSKVFLVCALFGALFNAGVILEGNTITSLLGLRFMTGFFLAGIYPVGMKIAADHFEKGLGKSLGYLVGALVLGTAFPHLLKGLTSFFPWTTVMLATSGLAACGGALMVALVPDGPFRKQGQKLDLSAFFGVFRSRNLRIAAFGYFGHMWELYAFWAFVPVMLGTFDSLHAGSGFNVPLLSFIIIASGGPACVIGGYLSMKFGAKRMAFIALLLSCLCCLLSPVMFLIGSPVLFIAFMVLWGMSVVADSPIFSTLVAQNAPAEIKGTALTLVNCIGFSITILSIQLLTFLNGITFSNSIYVVLAAGPVLGLIALMQKDSKRVL